MTEDFQKIGLIAFITQRVYKDNVRGHASKNRKILSLVEDVILATDVEMLNSVARTIKRYGRANKLTLPGSEADIGG